VSSNHGDLIGVQTRQGRMQDRAILDALRDHFDRSTAPVTIDGRPIPKKRTSRAAMLRWWKSLTESQRVEIRSTVGREVETHS